MHALLEAHYQGKNWRKVHKKYKKRFYAISFDDPEEADRMPEDVERLMTSYLMKYKAQDRKLRILGTEINETITLPQGLKFNFVIDLLYEDASGVWIRDHKFLRSFMDDEYMMLDTQLARYFYGAHVLGIKNLQGVVFNEIRTKAPTVPRILRSGGLSQAMRIDTDVYTYYRAIRDHGLDPTNYSRILTHLSKQKDKFFRRTHLPKSKALMTNTIVDLLEQGMEIKRAKKTGYYPRSIDKFQCRGCDYRVLCAVELHGGDVTEIIRYDYKTRGKRG